MNYIEELEVSCRIRDNFKNRINQKITNVQRGEKGLFCSLSNQKKVVIVSDLISANNFKKQLSAVGNKVEIISGISDSPVITKVVRKEKIFETISSIFSFIEGDTDTVIVLADILLQRFSNKDIFLKNKLNFKVDESYKFEDISKTLVSMGYKRVERVSEKGEFAFLGDAFFIYPINKESMFRIDFFDEQIEKINELRETTEEVESLQVLPTRLFFYDKKYRIELCDRMLASLKKVELPPNEKSNISTIVFDVIGRLELECDDSITSFIIPFMNKLQNDDEDVNILSILCDENTTVFIDEPKKVLDELFFVQKSNTENISNLISSGELLLEHRDFYIQKERVFSACKNSNIVVFENLKTNEDIFGTEDEIVSSSLGERKYVYDYKSLASDIAFYKKSGYTVVLFAGSESSSKAIKDFLLENHIIVNPTPKKIAHKEGIFITEEFLPLSASFIDEKMLLIGTEDLVKKYAKEDYQVKNKKNAFYLPKIGDYVVHDIHGIGKIIAIEKLKISTYEKDYFVIEYKGGDKLYVPSEQANLISLYIGGGEEQPKLNKIGGVEFAKVKERVIASVKKMAIDLLALYRERETLKGKVYPEKTSLEQEFEDAFEFEETDDQLEAIKEISKDMESGKIMERLVCGDVGYGKTEVALRAAFKTICDGGQVALLCPTTILSEQHYQTARKRMKDFFVQIASLNRFKTKKEQEVILNQLEIGNIDFIIGTSRLLSKDVAFKNLELLILDEEQRFGVADKEKIKELKKNVNVLTLSATPIPRTLHMSLTGIRDISIIETPPKNRIPVQTFVCPFSEDLLVEAVRKELSRAGQTIIVYNSVEKIDSFANRVRELVPEANVGIGHGQMGERELEGVIKKLYNHEYDVFIATTIVENGVDLPLANTLIVMDSVNLGLAQLYQLRGRVGRSNRLAYAYFTYREEKSITETAMKRLEALSEFTELGSGFRIAMRDLEIRGAGNVLGSEQHGHLEKVGYELYSKLLLSSVKELKGEKTKEQQEIKMEVNINAFVPDTYVQNEDERIKLYSNISEISTEKIYSAFLDETETQFGSVPKEVINLAKIAFAKNMAQRIDVKKVVCSSQKCYLELYKKENIIDEKTAVAIEAFKDSVVLKFDKLPIIDFNLPGKTVEKKLDSLISFLILATN